MDTSHRSVYVGTFVYCETLSRLSIFDGLIMVDQEGKISQIVKEADVSTEAIRQIVQDFGWDVEETTVHKAKANQFFFPGFIGMYSEFPLAVRADNMIDTHIHAPQFPNAGIFGKTTLLDWLKTYTYPIEASLADVGKAKKVYETCVSSTIAHGTTTASYYATIHVESTKALASICAAKGQRSLIGRVCMDHPSALVDYYRDENTAESKKATMAIIEHTKNLDPSGTHIAPILTPRSAVSCTSEQLHWLQDIANDPDYPLRIQTHLSENLSEMDHVKSTWPNHANYTAVYDAHGLLTPRTILAHAIHLDESERQCIAARGAKVSHCPVSNSALGSGMCKVRQLMDSGIIIGLGSDVSGGYSPSILEAARHACLVSRLVAADVEKEHKADGSKIIQKSETDQSIPEWDRVKLSVEEALWFATRGGAEVVGWHDRLGAFENGFQFDAQLVTFNHLESDEGVGQDPGNFQVFGWESWEDRIAKWMYCGDDRNTEKVWVDGRLIHTRSR